MTKSNIPPHIAKFISSQQMESLETQQCVIELGKALVKELEIEPGSDTLSRWLVHYIAELMVKLENAGEDQKSQLQQQCFESILTLWQHRSSFKSGHRPFESFEPILRTIAALDPENRNSYYQFWNQRELDESVLSDDVKQWTELAVGLDHAARTWIKFALDQATQHALDEKTSSWLSKAKGLPQDQELEVIIQLAGEASETIHDDNIKKLNCNKTKQFKEMLERLESFIEISDYIKTQLKNNIKILEQSLLDKSEA
ncbi:MAG: hypothetical protein M8364_06835 [Methylobacter sp.]|uniref:hypothetical protein n=1 Tax=Methylobacter sp. TaxID=2051955 RepID=UPI00258DB408|nr:hypothetical protein [Methylobacter sp.]MCL7420602.1 hypothetical protein [Methylobacter sp.]